MHYTLYAYPCLIYSCKICPFSLSVLISQFFISYACIYIFDVHVCHFYHNLDIVIMYTLLEEYCGEDCTYPMYCIYCRHEDKYYYN